MVLVETRDGKFSLKDLNEFKCHIGSRLYLSGLIIKLKKVILRGTRHIDTVSIITNLNP